ncbi:MAG: hypothetical protein IJP17_08010 [Clostridia bacterium]|nr:hypothetical protein [Clostridia bacterium]
MGIRATWTPEMKEQLVKLYRRNFRTLEIAERMGLEFNQIKGAIQHAKNGAWGDEIRSQMLFEKSAVEASSTEADTHEADIIPEDEPALEPASEPGHHEISAQINMIEAIDILAACAKLFNAENILEIRGSTSLDKAGITFRRGDKDYTLSILGTTSE